MNEVIPLGEVVTFFLPINKLTRYPHIKQTLENKLISDYKGYTKTEAVFEGHYKIGTDIICDQHSRYEVSFDGGLRAMLPFIQLIKEVCVGLREQSIYLTMGNRSYLIQPKVSIDN